MSALHAAPTRTTQDGRPVLRVVPAVEARPRRVVAGGLAPVTSAQAWRRRLGAVLVLSAMLVLIVVGAMSLAAPGGVVAAVPASASTVVVEPGQTLWGIAAAHAPAGTPTAAYVAALIEANGLAGPAVPAWQVLVLPAG